MKKLLMFVLVLVIAGGAFLYLRGGSLVQGIIEKVGSDVTQVPVTLDGVDLSLTEKKVGLRGLTVANPAGFESDHAFALGEVSVSLNSVSGDMVAIKEVLIDAPSVIYEVKTDGGSNIDVISSNIEKYAGSGGGEEATTEEGGEGPKITIDDVYIRNVQVAVSTPLLAGQEIGTKLPEIHLEDIGKDDGGASPAEVAQKILDAITKGVNVGIADIDLDAIMADAQAQLDAAAGKLTEAVDDVTKQATQAVDDAKQDAAKAVDDAKQDAAKSVDDAKKKASDALGGLFGGKKKDG